MEYLSEHNERRVKEYAALPPISASGVACDNCGMEMKLTNPGRVTASIPPQEAVHCTRCGKRGFKLA